MHWAFLARSAPPWPAPGLNVTPEIQYQSELWLPLDELRPRFHHLYRTALTYSPILSSTPFTNIQSWASIVSGFPAFLRHHTSPVKLLRQLQSDDELRMRFLFWSFMPGRYYGGGSDRYPRQMSQIAAWLRRRQPAGRRLRCLDAACGDGAGTYGVARFLLEQGWSPDSFEIEGWTLEPLEAWAAAHAAFPHDPARETAFRQRIMPVYEQKAHDSIVFKVMELGRELPGQEASPIQGEFDLIVCNGLLGGPIVNRPDEIRCIMSQLVSLLTSGGLLLAADHFHGGWKQKCPQQELRALWEEYGLKFIEVSEGVAALAPQAE